MKIFLSLTLLLCLLSRQELTAFCQAETPSEPAEIESVVSDLQSLLKEYYPQASFKRSSKLFQCQFKTRTFLIHHALKTGEWQEASPQLGPDRGGILCSLSWQSGRWQGAAVVPQSFDDKYFTSSLMAPYNKKLNVHLEARLSYPKDIKAPLLERYAKLINRFADTFE